MMAFDQRTSVPAKWSLKPEDTLGLMFWTKDPENLIQDAALLKPYRVKVHVTVTGWSEVEKGAPSLYEGAKKLCRAAEVFGPENVIWRFSPVPVLLDVVTRFRAIAAMAGDAGIKKVFVSFLQENDRVPEPRTVSQKTSLLQQFASEGWFYGVKVLLCNDDRALNVKGYRNLDLGVCAPPEDFSTEKQEVDTCGCGFSVDPFTINESCSFGCQYCYAGSVETAPKKRNTTKLTVLR